MKKILTALLFASMAAPTFAFGEAGGTTTRSTTCVNDSVVAYFPFAPSWSDNSYLYFFTEPDVQVSSFEATINGYSRPVEYKTFGPFLRARVVIEETDQPVNATFGVGRVGACNSPVSYTFNRA